MTVVFVLLLSSPLLRLAAAPLVDVFTEDAALFTKLLASTVPERRIEGIQGLSHMKHWPAEQGIARLLGDSSALVRREAVLALGRLGTAASVPGLIALLDSPDWELRDNARLALARMTGHDCEGCSPEQWRSWWNGTSLARKQQDLLAIINKPHTNAPAPSTKEVMRRGKRVRVVSSTSPPACPERREALRALRHLADGLEPALVSILARPQTPPLDADERTFICEALDRIGTTNSIAVLAGQRNDAAAWALARIGGPGAERALLRLPPTLAVLTALDRLHSTNTAGLIPFLVQNMGQITYRVHPDDVMNDELQPIQRLGLNLIRRSGLAAPFIEATLQELENTMQPPVLHGPMPVVPDAWTALFKKMGSELKPGFVREDGVTTSQPLVTTSYLADDPKLVKRLLPLLNHPAFVPRVYVALMLGRMHAAEAFPALTNMINDGYAFSDATALASGKHFGQSQTVRWKGFLCMALGRMGGEQARLALEQYAANPAQPRDVRYSSVVGLRFIGSAKSLGALRRVAEQDLIWMVRDEARRASETIELLAAEKSPKVEAHR